MNSATVDVGVPMCGLGSEIGPSFRASEGSGLPMAKRFLKYQKLPVKSSAPSQRMTRALARRVQQEPNANGQRGNRPNKCVFGAQCESRTRAAASSQAASPDRFVSPWAPISNAIDESKRASPTTSS